MTKNVLEMINDLDDKMVLSVMDTPKAKGKTLPFKKLRWTAVAASIALLLAVPVMAEVFGFSLDFNADKNLWHANTNARFAPEEYSEEVKKVKGQEYFVMQNLSEAEEFLGIDLPDNAVLEKSLKKFTSTEFKESGIKQEVHCSVSVIENEGNLLGTHADAWYVLPKRLGENLVNVHYSTICEQNPIENGGGFGYCLEDELSKSEKYITPSGRECEIVSIEGEYSYDEMAVTEVNRVLVIVQIYGQDKESVRNSIIAVLDAYN
ncbi:MAG: hypothetical protein IKL18_01380 [Oscillospiraceae bacterium]|nr:hypothetical protein [Oscillospiraceae bacterium]MBR6656806.1 hypothetical protein [Oscillospiraceae bacterium]